MFHVIMVETGPRRNIKTVFPSYGDSHVKDKTVARPPPPLQIVLILWPAVPKRSPSYSKIWIPSDFGIAIMATAKFWIPSDFGIAFMATTIMCWNTY